jgi:spore germination cell wall hydrolase CwlJ-like protein
MNGKILALLFAVALTFTTGAAQACGGYAFNAAAPSVIAAANNPVLPPAADKTSRHHHSARVAASRTLNSAGASASGLLERRSPALNFAATAINSWSQKLKAFVDRTAAEKSCLTTAIYFEARSESEQGQLAVARVILNRTMAANYPSSICGVVYQNASRLNACQFSFACDGKHDRPDDDRAWQTALAVTTLALAVNKEVKDRQMLLLATATNYHADYVDPRWSRSLNRLTKIGRHIFYSQG